VTDANVLLGYIDPQFFLGGEIKLDRQAADVAGGAIASCLDVPLGAAASVSTGRLPISAAPLSC
jgi:N-methylhydantoinase A